MIGSREAPGALHAAPTRVVPFPAAIEKESGDPNGQDFAWPAAARWWFAALDGRPLGEGADNWVVQVVGMHVDGNDLWIQLESADDPDHGLLLHVIRGANWYNAMSTLYPPRDR